MGKSVKHGLIIFVVLMGLFYLALCLLYFGKIVSNDDKVEHVSDNLLSLQVGGVEISVLPAITEDELARGLSGRESITMGEGMLFVFRKPDIYRFWMRDMNFPIDIIWIDADRRVVGLDLEVKPESYPAYFMSVVPVNYVLEVKAGFAERYGIEVGDRVAF